MVEKANKFGGKVEAFPEAAQPRVVSDELDRLLSLLRDSFPDVRNISFEFDGRLHVHIDLRSKEQLALVEERLPYLGGGRLFSEPRRGDTPKRPFDHRISALVAR